jgi:hypothetical protein
MERCDLAASDPFQPSGRDFISPDHLRKQIAVLLNRRAFGRPFHAFAVKLLMMRYQTPDTARSRNSFAVLAALLVALAAVLALSACGPAACEGPAWDRAIRGTITLGVHEVARVFECPSDEDLAKLKSEAASGDPDAQYVLSRFYRRQVSDWSEYSESAERVGANLLLCAAVGGSHEAQAVLGIWSSYPFEEPEASRISYKYARLSAERRDCDCAASPSIFSACYQICSTIERVREGLSARDIEKLEQEIAAFEPAPVACEVEIVAE